MDQHGQEYWLKMSPGLLHQIRGIERANREADSLVEGHRSFIDALWRPKARKAYTWVILDKAAATWFLTQGVKEWKGVWARRTWTNYRHRNPSGWLKALGRLCQEIQAKID